MVNQTCCRLLGGHGPQEGLADQILRHTLCHMVYFNTLPQKQAAA